jgi:hypothetical protein
VADQPDLDEPFSLYPLDGEDVLRRLLGKEAEEDVEEDAAEGEDS